MMTSLALERVEETITKCEDVLEKIRKRAIEKWGEVEWKARLTDRYTAIRIATDKKDATKIKCRSHIETIFSSGQCKADTLFQLVAAVECQVKFFCNTEM